MENRIRVLLAGKAATELFLNIVDVGVGSDLDRAKNIIERIIEVYAKNNFKYWGVKSGVRSEYMIETFERDAVAMFEEYYSDAKNEQH